MTWKSMQRCGLRERRRGTEREGRGPVEVLSAGRKAGQDGSLSLPLLVQGPASITLLLSQLKEIIFHLIIILKEPKEMGGIYSILILRV